jgi:hypothetical protein
MANNAPKYFPDTLGLTVKDRFKNVGGNIHGISSLRTYIFHEK